MSNTISGSSAPLTGWMFLPKQNEHGNKPPEPVGQLIDGTGKSKKFDRTDFNGYNLNSRPENEFSVNWRKEQEENPTPPKEPNDHIVDNANGTITSTPSGYDSIPNAVSAYNSVTGGSIHAAVSSIDITAPEGKSVETIYPVFPQFPDHVE